MKEKILVVDDEKLIRWSLEKELTKKGYEVRSASSCREAHAACETEIPDLVLLDIQLPDGDGTELLREIKHRDPLTAVIMITANDRISTAVDCIKRGAFHYLHKPFRFEEAELLVAQALENRLLRKRIGFWETQEKHRYPVGRMISSSPAMQPANRLIREVSQSGARTVLLQGESGTGKDLAAKIIHYAGPRAEKPFLTLNCAAVPVALIESELFGHEKGAFTDARDIRKGLAEEADGGTLFLDEIGDMPSEMQAKLLGLIENKTFRRIGSAREKESDICIIAATHKDLKNEVKKGNFREDLFYRLNVIPIYLPPLRERKEDIRELASFFVAQFNHEFHKEVSEIDREALEIMEIYDWPGNVRELRNVIERAMILNQETVIRREHLPAEIDCRCEMADKYRTFKEGEAANKLPQCLAGMPLEAIEKHALIIAMEQSRGRQSRAAELLGIGRDALRYKLQKYELLSPKES